MQNLASNNFALVGAHGSKLSLVVSEPQHISRGLSVPTVFLHYCNWLFWNTLEALPRYK